MAALDQVFQEVGTDQAVEVGTDQAVEGEVDMDTILQQSGDKSDLAGAPTDDGGKEDSVADAKPEADDGVPKEVEDDKSVDG